MSDSKLDETILHLNIQISNYELLRCNRNRNGEGAACYIRSDIGYLQKHFFLKKIEDISIEIILHKINPLIIGIIYRPPDQGTFLQIINANVDKLDINIKELNILGDFNINMYKNNKYIVLDDNTISLKFLSSDIKNYHQFCTMHGLK